MLLSVLLCRLVKCVSAISFQTDGAGTLGLKSWIQKSSADGMWLFTLISPDVLFISNTLTSLSVCVLSSSSTLGTWHLGTCALGLDLWRASPKLCHHLFLQTGISGLICLYTNKKSQNPQNLEIPMLMNRGYILKLQHVQHKSDNIGETDRSRQKCKSE